MESIIKSLLDNDLYKFSMQNAVLKLFPTAKVRYSFIVRSKVEFPEGFAEALRKQIWHMKDLRLSSIEYRFFTDKCKYIDPSYFDFLQGYFYNPSEVGIIQNGGELQLNIEGPWYRTILWETPLLALISELYFKMSRHLLPIKAFERHDSNVEKAKFFAGHNIKVAEFGTRRRYSYENQDEVIKDFLQVTFNKWLVGTSNVHFAHKYNLTLIGTEAHEWFMFHGAKYGFQMANELALKHWADVYQGDLGTALCDTYTTDSFLRSFNKRYSKLYDGVRQDSGDPFEFMNKLIEHYKKMGIDPMSKTIVFSDSLNPDKAIELNKACNGKIKCSFGIGTNLSNDVGVTPLNMVIKMTAAKPSEDSIWIPTIKLSDHPGKHTGDSKMIEVCKYLLNIK